MRASWAPALEALHRGAHRTDARQGIGEQPWPGRSLPYFSQDRAALLAALIRQYFLVMLFRACAESLACEHAARLAVMQRADKNIAEHLQVLNNQYRQQRQSAITEELQDIIAGGLYLD